MYPLYPSHPVFQPETLWVKKKCHINAKWYRAHFKGYPVRLAVNLVSCSKVLSTGTLSNLSELCFLRTVWYLLVVQHHSHMIPSASVMSQGCPHGLCWQHSNIQKLSLNKNLCITLMYLLYLKPDPSLLLSYCTKPNEQNYQGIFMRIKHSKLWHQAIPTLKPGT